MAHKKWTPEKLRRESSYWRSCLLITAAQLDLFGWLGNREKSPAAVAAHFGGDAQGWEIFLNALCGMGLLRKRAERFSNTAFALRYLGRAEATVLLPAYDAWDIWGGLASSLITGKRPKTQKPFVSDRAKAERLLRGLHLHAQQIAPYLIEKLPLTGCRTLLDVGGGLGIALLILRISAYESGMFHQSKKEGIARGTAIGDKMRANLFAYREADDPWLREMRHKPVADLNHPGDTPWAFVMKAGGSEPSRLLL
jgi:hypothetical protein